MANFLTTVTSCAPQSFRRLQTNERGPKQSKHAYAMNPALALGQPGLQLGGGGGQLIFLPSFRLWPPCTTLLRLFLRRRFNRPRL